MLRRLVPPALLAVMLAACADHTLPTESQSSSSAPPALVAAPGSPVLSASARSDEVRLEQLARRVARSLRNPAFRAYLKGELDRSQFAEHKVHFQRFLKGNGRRALRDLARDNDEADSAVEADADAAIPVEMYFPVAAHRAAWSGDENILVATEVEDHEAPIAFDLQGRRQLLDPKRPPSTPVLAIVPVETDFDRLPAAHATCVTADACGGTGGGSGGGDAGGGGKGGGIVPNQGGVPGLYLTHAQFAQSFEGWLKGDPEFEIHIMGPAAAGDTANLASFQCIGEKAPAGYTWDMNALTWNGSQLLFSNAQMDAFKGAYPGRAYVIFAVEDDDTACGIRTDSDRGNALLKAIGQAYANYKAAKDSSVWSIGGVTRILKAAQSGSNFLTSLYNFLKSNDDIIGVAVSDAVSGRYSTTTNWTVLDKDLNTNGAFKLEMH